MQAHRQIVHVTGTQLVLDLPPNLGDRRLEVIVLPAEDTLSATATPPTAAEIQRILQETRGAWGYAASPEAVSAWIDEQRRLDWPEEPFQGGDP
jgi:hypothetical protein